MQNSGTIQAKAYFYDPAKQVHLVEVNLMGMTISKIQVKPSPKHPEAGLWVDMPAVKGSDNRWKKIITFTKSSPLWPHVEAAARRAAAEYEPSQPSPTTGSPTRASKAGRYAPSGDYVPGADEVDAMDIDAELMQAFAALETNDPLQVHGDARSF